MKQEASDQNLRRMARTKGIGVSKRYNDTLGRVGYMLYDLCGENALAGHEPTPYYLTYEEAVDYVRAAEEVQ